MTYTVVAYRENGADYCMGHILGTSESAIEIGCFVEPKEVVDFLFGILKRQHEESGNEFCKWEFNFIVNGIPSLSSSGVTKCSIHINELGPDTYEHSLQFEELMNEAENLLEGYIEERNARLKKEKEEKAAKAEEDARARRKLKYEKLKKEFEGD